ncbi:MAG: Gfo/Idh/MocA family oxidoreductase [Candidatus Marinimicrobia bacterium]|nr:Gfo/Idh/MocA family oxidoreductase [Candidatus Neomarinimicrobiota bacterium]MCF7880132.1 Gfo/Idh/MocA family oxidoreductase [Candidatus Neomarinimicrobiota bacterium]
MKSVKAAIIGGGFMGRSHIEALKRIGGVEIEAIVDSELTSAQNIAEMFNVPEAFGNWEMVLKNESVQVIHNCTPNNLHYEINKAALQAGKHVISEKPLTLTAKESADLVKIAEETGLVTAIDFNYRFYPLIRQARNLVTNGEVGSIYLVHGHYLQDWLYYDTDYNWRLEPEISGKSRAVADIGSHWCDMVQFVTGSKITEVFADLATIHKTRKKPGKHTETFKGKEEGPSDDYTEVPVNTEDAGSILVHFDNGAQGVFTVSQVSAGRKNHFWFEVDGSKKALSWDQEEPNSLWIGHREKANEVMIKDPSLLDDDARRYAHFPGGHPEGYPDGPKNLFRDVYDFIRRGGDPITEEVSFPTFADGHYENKIVEAVLESNEKQQWVSVE